MFSSLKKLKLYSRIIKIAVASAILHYLFIMYFPVEWLDKLPVIEVKPPTKSLDIELNIDGKLTDEPSGAGSSEESEQEGTGGQFGNGQEPMMGVDQEKWGSLLERLEENTGFKEGYIQTYEGLDDKNPTSKSYIYRERHHEDIVVKEVFPTIYNIDQPFDEIIKAAPQELSEFESRNGIIEQYRSKQSIEQADLAVEILSNTPTGDLGPLKFPPAERQKFFDETLTLGKTKQLSDFIDKYFQYDPNEGDLPIATRELYSKNLERLLYAFSNDPTYFYLDFYLENLNKEDFLHNALDQASRLHGSKTATELLFAIERIYEIQQRAWKTYYDFDAHYENIPKEKRDRLRVETLKRVNKRYKAILEEKEIEDIEQIGEKYFKRRYEIFEYIADTTPDGYRLHDAVFERAAMLWEMGLQSGDQNMKRQAITQWQGLIDEANQNGHNEDAFNDFTNLKHIKHLEGLLKIYEREPEAKKAARERTISNMLKQRKYTEHKGKRQREEKILWPKE